VTSPWGSTCPFSPSNNPWEAGVRCPYPHNSPTKCPKTTNNSSPRPRRTITTLQPLGRGAEVERGARHPQHLPTPRANPPPPPPLSTATNTRITTAEGVTNRHHHRLITEPRHRPHIGLKRPLSTSLPTRLPGTEQSRRVQPVTIGTKTTIPSKRKTNRANAAGAAKTTATNCVRCLAPLCRNFGARFPTSNWTCKSGQVSK